MTNSKHVVPVLFLAYSCKAMHFSEKRTIFMGLKFYYIAGLFFNETGSKTRQINIPEGP